MNTSRFMSLMPDHPLPAWGRHLILGFLLLSLPAYWIGYRIQSSRIKAQGLQFTLERQEFIDAAREFALSRNLDTSAWRAFCATEANDALHALYYQSPESAQFQLGRPAVEVRVVLVNFRSGEPSPRADVRFSPAGLVVGYAFDLGPTDHEDPGESRARELAEEELRRITDLPLSGQPDQDEVDIGNQIRRTFTWKVASPFEQASFGYKIRVDGDYVSEVIPETEVEGSVGGKHGLGFIVYLVLTSLALTGAYLFAFVRYVIRTNQKEISHRRGLLIGATIGLAGAIGYAVNLIDMNLLQPNVHKNLLLFWIIAGVAILAQFVVGLVMGGAWGGVEADLRESDSKKLTSLDCLAAGHIFSHNSCRAAIIGLLAAGWMVLATAAVQTPWRQSAQVVSPWALFQLSHAPFLYVILAPLQNTVQYALAGLLVPASLAALLARSGRRPSIRQSVWMAAALLGFLGIGGLFQPVTNALATALVVTVAALLIYRSYDLLTSCLAVGAYSAFLLFSGMTASTSINHGDALLLGTIAFVVLAACLWGTLRGRRYLPTQVRPVYAAHLAQRRAMQAEVSAARQAQIRLTPRRHPKVRGLEAVAECRPSREVGGDFYDFFPIDSSRMGVFLAEGGGHGLSSALAIAYAKGLLMPLIDGSVDPQEVIEKLRASLAPLTSDSQELGLLFALIDMENRTLQYARIGAFPQLMVIGSDGAIAVEESQTGADQAVSQASIALKGGLRILLFTDGLAGALQDEDSTPLTWLADFLMSQRGSAQSIGSSFMKALEPRLKDARKKGREDDLSFVLLQLEATPSTREAAA